MPYHSGLRSGPAATTRSSILAFETAYPVYIADDDPDIRASLAMLLEVSGISSRSFANGDLLLCEIGRLAPGCLLLDVRMPGSDGLTVLGAIREAGLGWPVVVLTGHAEVQTAVRAMKMGAIEFLEKPFEEAELFEALDRAFEILDAHASSGAEKADAEARIAALSGRELELLQALVNGRANKQIAGDLGISIRTVEMHRASLMRKLQAKSLAEAVLLATAAGMAPQAPPSRP